LSHKIFREIIRERERETRKRAGERGSRRVFDVLRDELRLVLSFGLRERGVSWPHPWGFLSGRGMRVRE
jgi:hypothetical protein